MNNNTFFTLVFVCILTHIIRTAYEILKHKKMIIPDKLSFTIIFLNMAVLWVSWISLCKMDPYKINLSSILSYFGFALCIAGLIIFLVALFTIKTLETYNGNLITKGVYSRIRHPMYLGFIFWSIVFPIFYGAVFSFFLSFLFIGNILFWRYLEELELMKRFDGYLLYKTKTFF